MRGQTMLKDFQVFGVHVESENAFTVFKRVEDGKEKRSGSAGGLRRNGKASGGVYGKVGQNDVCAGAFKGQFDCSA